MDYLSRDRDNLRDHFKRCSLLNLAVHVELIAAELQARGSSQWQAANRLAYRLRRWSRAAGPERFSARA